MPDYYGCWPLVSSTLTLATLAANSSIIFSNLSKSYPKLPTIIILKSLKRDCHWLNRTGGSGRVPLVVWRTCVLFCEFAAILSCSCFFAFVSILYLHHCVIACSNFYGVFLLNLMYLFLCAALSLIGHFIKNQSVQFK